MRKSKADTAATRKHIVATASRMFLTHGLVATNIADIMAAAGLTQGGFYRHFESKEQLMAEANHLAFDQLLDMFDRTVTGMTPADAIETIVCLYLRQLMSEDPLHMCPIANLGSELGRSVDQVRTAGADGYERLVRLLADKAKQMNIVEYEKVANAIVSTMVGAVTVSRLTRDTPTVDSVLTDAQDAVKRLLQSAG